MAKKKITANKKLKNNIFKKLDKISGFSLIEVLIVLVIIGILASLAIPKYTSSATKAKQVEAKQILKQIYVMQKSYKTENESFWIPPAGTKASKDNPLAFSDLGVDIMPQARYVYEISGDENSFTATATATNLDDDPTIDQWGIDESGQLFSIVDDAKK